MATGELDCPMEYQHQDAWCWAAVTAAVVNYYAGAGAVTQCAVASSVLGMPSCSGGPCVRWGHPLCNDEEYPLQGSLAHYGHFASYRPGPAVSDFQKQQIKQVIMDEVAAGRPVCAQIDFGGGFLHFVLIRGFSFFPGGGNVMVEDPQLGYSEPEILDLIYNYKSTGTWINTYLTRPAGG